MQPDTSVLLSSAEWGRDGSGSGIRPPRTALRIAETPVLGLNARGTKTRSPVRFRRVAGGTGRLADGRRCAALTEIAIEV